MYNRLKEMDLFKNISQESIEKINNMNYLIKEYDSNESVYQMGDEINYFNVILNGALKTNEYMIDGKEIVSSYYFENDAFPFYLIYGGETHYPYNVYSYKKSRVCHLPVKDVLDCLEEDFDFMKNVLTFVSEYTCYNKMVIRATQYNRVIKRLAYWLLYSGDENSTTMPGSQGVLSNILRVNRCTLNQQLVKLERNNIIRIEGTKILLLDREYIEKLQE